MSDFILGMYVAWTLPFFVLVGIILIGSIFDYYNHSFRFIVLFTIVFIIANYFVDNLEFDWTIIPNILLSLIAYLLVGVLWSFIRVRLLIHKLDKLYAKYSVNQSYTNIVNRLDREFKKYGGFPLELNRLKPFIHVSILYWPLGIIGYLVQDTLTNIISSIYLSLGNTYEKILNMGLSQYRNDRDNNQK